MFFEYFTIFQFLNHSIWYTTLVQIPMLGLELLKSYLIFSY